MKLQELKALWEDRLSALTEKKRMGIFVSNTPKLDLVNVEAKIAELTECLHELGQLDSGPNESD